jgi:hypothetical protein
MTGRVRRRIFHQDPDGSLSLSIDNERLTTMGHKSHVAFVTAISHWDLWGTSMINNGGYHQKSAQPVSPQRLPLHSPSLHSSTPPSHFLLASYTLLHSLSLDICWHHFGDDSSLTMSLLHCGIDALWPYIELRSISEYHHRWWYILGCRFGLE